MYQGKNHKYVITSRRKQNKQTNKKPHHCLHSNSYWPISLKFGMMIETTDTSFSDFYFHSRSQLYGKSTASAFIFSQIFQ